MQTQALAIKQPKFIPLVYVFAAWAIYMLLYVSLKASGDHGNFANQMQAVFTIILRISVTSYFFVLWKKSPEVNKKFFGFFALANGLALADTLIYRTIFYFLHLTHAQLSPFWLASYNTPYLGYLVFTFLAFTYVLPKAKLLQPKSNIFIYIPALIVMLSLFFMFFYAYQWKGAPFSLAHFFDVAESALQLPIFIACLLCLALAKDKALLYLALNSALVIPADFTMEMHFFSQNFGIGSVLETSWILGIFLDICALSIFQKTTAYKSSFSSWTSEPNSIKVQFTFWPFLLMNLAVVLFLSCSYMFSPHSIFSRYNSNLLESFFPIFAWFSSGTIIMSSLFAKKLCASLLSKPLNRLSALATRLLNEQPTSESGETINKDILEFRNVENLLQTACNNSVEKNKAQQDLVNLARQVAHDIRSPLYAVDATTKTLQNVPEDARIIIRQAVRRINDIANNLLSKHKSQTGDKTEKLTTELIAPIIDSIISEKRVSISDSMIQFNSEFNDAYDVFVEINLEKFKRVLSNILNNSIEALKNQGKINLILQHSLGQLTLTISDNGEGIPEDVLPKLFTRGMSTKEKGHGLGLAHAKECVESWHGEICIKSQIGKGTQTIIALPCAAAPKWFAQSITIRHNSKIAVLDDDEAIHGVWKQRLTKIIPPENNIEIKHFFNPRAFGEWFASNHAIDNSYLIDYEFINSDIYGTNLVKNLELPLSQATLVTSRYEEAELRTECEKMGIKMLPKNLAPHILIEVMCSYPENPDFILIDDSDSIRRSWQNSAILANKKAAAFASVSEFMNVSDKYNRDIPIYIDSNLGDGVAKGEFAAKEIYERGFKTIYLSSGDAEIDIKDYYWIKRIIIKKLCPF